MGLYILIIFQKLKFEKTQKAYKGSLYNTADIKLLIIVIIYYIVMLSQVFFLLQGTGGI